MKIAVNSRIYQLANTGIQNYIKELYTRLQRIDKKNSYVFLQTDSNKSLGETIVTGTKSSRVTSFLFDLFQINSLLNKVPSIKIFHGPAHILPFMKKKGVKYIVTIHDLSFLVLPDSNDIFFRLYYKWAIGRSLQNADVVIADSENTKKDITKFYNTSPHKIKVVYLGVNDYFIKQEKPPRFIKEKYFFSISTHMKRKNIVGVLEAFAKTKDLHSLKYIIAGLIPDQQLNELKNKIVELGLQDRVSIIGYVTDEQLKSLYSYAEFFIYPTFYEGFGIPVLEAMVCNCPVITSSNSSLLELVPSNDWLVDPHDTDTLAKRMVEILKLDKQKKEKLLEMNYKHSLAFKWENTAKQMLEVLSKLQIDR